MTDLFKGINGGILGARNEKKAMEAICEAVVGDDFGTEMIPFSSEEEDAIVDSDSVPNKDIDSAYAELDKYLDSDDEDLESLLEDEDYEALGDDGDDE